MGHVRVSAKVVTDNTGASLSLPVILVDVSGQLRPLEPLLDYLVKYQAARSLAWMNKLCQVVGMLLDYLAANHAQFAKPIPFFESFAERVYSGTIGENGKDPSGLYWLPRDAKGARQLLQMLSDFSDDMAKALHTRPINPWETATTAEQRMNWAAFINKSERSFLGHLHQTTKVSEASKIARRIKHRKTPHGELTATKAFPNEMLPELLFKGFVAPGQAASTNALHKYDWRGICIALLMNGGGLRDCECFHLWVHDVRVDPLRPEIALVRVYHPQDGTAPSDFKLPNGKRFANRAAYLALRHPGYPPRNKAVGAYHAGWKNPKLSDANEKYLHVHWFPASYGQLFLVAWRLYMAQRISQGIASDRHPFLFVSTHGKWFGEPYTIDSYREAHARAVRKIGLTPKKNLGTTEHGHRHAYGQRVASVSLDGNVIQAGLHHSSLESQQVYTEPSIQRVTALMDKASATHLDESDMQQVEGLLSQLHAIDAPTNVFERSYETRKNIQKKSK